MRDAQGEEFKHFCKPNARVETCVTRPEPERVTPNKTAWSSAG
jgi:hypothetical protein